MLNQNSLTKSNNGVATESKKEMFSAWIRRIGNKLIETTYQEPKQRARFTSNLMSVVSNNPKLQECEYGSLLSCAMQAEAYELTLSPQLGYCYAVPFQKKEYNHVTRQREVVSTTATFQLGYKGYIQLALRSGIYKNIDVMEVKEGELKEWDVFKNDINIKSISDFKARKEAKTIGYFGFFELLNGFRKEIYVPIEDMEHHANEYSQAFNLEDYKKLQQGLIPEKDMWKYSSYWYKNFNEMGRKTVIRHLLGKWGPMSIEMQSAYVSETPKLYDFDLKDGELQLNVATEEKENLDNNTKTQQEIFDKYVDDENGVVGEYEGSL